MDRLLVGHIGTLVFDSRSLTMARGEDFGRLQLLNDAWLLVEDGKFSRWGTMVPLPAASATPPTASPSHRPDATTFAAEASVPGTEVVDALGGMVVPSFCDCHTHLVYAGSRESEFVDKIRGLSYAEIARRGGGILNSARRLHQLTEDQLFSESMVRVAEIIGKGTGAVEIKSGYGLNLDDELKMLRVIRRIREAVPIPVVATFLGAHAVPAGMSRDDYVSLVVGEMIPEVGRQGLADFVDVFCENGFFTPADACRILDAGARYGLRGKVHAQQLSSSGGLEAAIRHGAVSADHLESMDDHDFSLLASHWSQAAGATTVPVALPGSSFFLRMNYADGRRLVQTGAPLALASDYNPGSTPSGDMKFVLSLACIYMRLLPAEALHAATLNGASAMVLGDRYGSVARGKVANFFITFPSQTIDFLPYAYTTPVVSRVFLRGQEWRPQSIGQ